MLLSLIPELGAAAMRELESYPLPVRILRNPGYILVLTGNCPRNMICQVIEGARRVHEKGDPVLICPGGR